MNIIHLFRQTNKNATPLGMALDNSGDSCYTVPSCTAGYAYNFWHDGGAISCQKENIGALGFRFGDCKISMR